MSSSTTVLNLTETEASYLLETLQGVQKAFLRKAAAGSFSVKMLLELSFMDLESRLRDMKRDVREEDEVLNIVIDKLKQRGPWSSRKRFLMSDEKKEDPVL